ncbi:MAG: adenosylcobinamide amidohydrolase [Syntrophobacteraceae bacterium]
MLLGTYYNGVEIHREEKIVHARFLVPHRVISTCRAAGGLRDDLTFLYNHQSCEPSGHDRPIHRLASQDPIAYRKIVCCRYGLPDQECATLATAANMRYAAIKQANFRDLEVVALCTGGVETNAGRAGDPASVYETNGIFERIGKQEHVTHGTINTLLFISRELTQGAMVRAVMTATEAKTAALQELSVNSRYSDGLATGTGTDQIGIAARLNTDTPLTGAGKHCVLGELIGKTVHDAVFATLGLQNGLTPERQRSALIHLERFGTTGTLLLEKIESHLNEADATLLRDNFKDLERDPLVVAAVAAIVHLRDKVSWGIIPSSCVPELWATYGGQIAAAVSGDYIRMDAYRQALAAKRYAFANGDLIHLVAHAMALGFREKWLNPAAGEVSSKD